jgi:hypothetical protein
MKRLLVGGIATLSLTLLVGCSGFDSTEMFMHPDTVAASSSYDAVLINLYTYIDTSTTISKQVKRDSLHLLVGMSESWDVLGARMVAVKDMKPDQLLALQSGAVDEVAIAGLFQKYAAQAVDVPADAVLAAKLKGQTISAHTTGADTKVNVAVDKVAQWKGFSAPVNIVFEKGDKPDTIVPLDSAISFAIGSGLMPDSTAASIAALKNNPLIKMPDTIGISVVPIVIFLKIKVGTAIGNDTLFCFTKTDSMNPKPSAQLSAVALLANMPALGKMEAGGMVYAPVTVRNGAAVTHAGTSFVNERMTARFDKATGAVRLNLGNFDLAGAKVGIYTLQGTLLATLLPRTARIEWNGRDAHGCPVSAGTYFVRLSNASAKVTGSFQITR